MLTIFGNYLPRTILGNKKPDIILNITKISIIIFVSLYLVGNFIPFYEGSDSYFYGIVSVNLSNGKFDITNELLQETGRQELVGTNWSLSKDNHIVPRAGNGLTAIGAIFYLLGGYYGLFYLSPIFAILLLISSERIATNLLGKYVGLITLLLLATNNLLLRNSINLQTESTFSFFFILGCFFLIRYVRSMKNYHILLSSLFFVGSTFIRLNGVVGFPIEIIIVLGFFVFQFVRRKQKNMNFNWKKSSSKISFRFSKKNVLIFSSMLLIPWIVFSAHFVLYNDYFFGDPNFNYISDGDKEHRWYDTRLSSLVKFENEDYENLKAYSKYLLPYQFPALHNRVDQNFDDVLGDNWLGIISLLVLFTTLIVSLSTKNSRIVIISFLILIIAFVWFYSAITTAERASFGIAGRYMLPIFAFSSMMIGFLIISILKIKSKNYPKISRNVIIGLKIVFVGIIVIFFITAFYFSPSVQIIMSEGFKFNDPQKFSERYPLDLEGLTENSVIVNLADSRAIEYGVIPFNPMTEGEITSESIELLNQILEKKYDVYMFKMLKTEKEKNVYRILINDYNLTLTDYSKTFCIIEAIGEKNSETKIDQVCIKELN